MLPFPPRPQPSPQACGRLDTLLAALALTDGHFEGRVAVITGGGGGIGAQLGGVLTRLGARVATLDRHDAGQLDGRPPPALHVDVDLARDDAMDRAMDIVESALGPVDLFVHCAADFRVRDFIAETDRDWSETFFVGIRAFVHGVKRLVPGMCARGRGVVVSMLAAEGIAHVAASSAAKAALRSATKSLSAELQPHHGVHAFSVMPALVDTPFLRADFTGFLDRIGLDLDTFVARTRPNVGYPGLMPALDCAAAMVYTLAHPDHYDGTIVDPSSLLAERGCTPESQPADTHHTTAPTDPRVDRLRTEVREVRARNRALDALVQARSFEAHRLAAVVESSTDAIITVGRDRRIETWNHAAEELFGHEASEVVGQEISIIVPPEVRTDHLRAFRAFWSPGFTPRTLECVRVHKDGTRIPVSLRLSPVRDGSGAVVSASAVIRDNRPRLEAEQALAHARARVQSTEKMAALGRLAGGVAHDLNNMLMVVQGGVSAALEALPPGSHAAEALSDVLSAALRTRGLARQLVTVSTHRPNRLQVVDLHSVLVHLESRLLTRMGPGQHLALPGPPSAEVQPVPVSIDVNQFEEMLGHILDNARAATSDDGRVELALDIRATGGIELHITDDGAGMDPKVARRAFEPFFTTRPFGVGAGMGLALVYGTMLGLGGSARLESSQGVGTRVSLFFPRSNQDISTPTHRGRVAIVCVQHRLMRRAVQRMLERIGFHTLPVGRMDALPAQAVDGSQPAELLVTDTSWSHESVNTVSRWVRSRTPALPWIFLVDAAATRVPASARESGVSLSLPFTMDDLQRAVRRASNRTKTIEATRSRRQSTPPFRAGR
mgnify:FL=1